MNDKDHLVLLTGSNKGRVFPIEATVTIGRLSENTIQFDDLQVSRRHAQVYRRQDGVYIKDLGSGNGVFVGTQRVSEQCLRDGDIIRIGKQQIQFRAAQGSAKVGKIFSNEIAEDESATSTVESEKADKLFETFFEVSRDSLSAHQLQEIQNRLRAVYVANQAIASERSLEKVLDTIMDQIFGLLQVHNGIIALRNEETGDLTTEYVRSAEPGAQIRVSASIIRRCFYDGEAIITSDARGDSRFGAGLSIIAENITSAMCVPLIHWGETFGVIYVDNHARTAAFTNRDLELFVALASSAATAILNAQYLKKVEQSYQDTLVALANAIELRDHYTVGHTWRVTNIAMEIARQLGWDETKINEVQMGGVLHDIGKIAVDNAILAKNSPLTDEEFAQMKVHPKRGADLLRDVKFLHPIIPYCLYHHERWDGKGYPFGIQGRDIPIEGRLIAVADAFDAMTSNRSYRAAMDPNVAMAEIVKGKGTQFDPEIVDALQKCFESGRIDRIPQEYFKKDARSIACPFCSTFIRLEEGIGPGSSIQCHVCHRNISLIQKDGSFMGVLTQRSTWNITEHN